MSPASARRRVTQMQRARVTRARIPHLERHATRAGDAAAGNVEEDDPIGVLARAELGRAILSREERLVGVSLPCLLHAGLQTGDEADRKPCRSARPIDREGCRERPVATAVRAELD